MEINFILNNPKAHHKLGVALGQICVGKNKVIYLQGELGAGKTTLARGILEGLGYQGKVKSPTYALIETYVLNFPEKQLRQTICHVDLYRIHSPSEIASLGLQDYAQLSLLSSNEKMENKEKIIYLIEWPENGFEELPKPDITCYIAHLKNKRSCCVVSHSARGRETVLSLSQIMHPVIGLEEGATKRRV